MLRPEPQDASAAGRSRCSGCPRCLSVGIAAPRTAATASFVEVLAMQPGDARRRAGRTAPPAGGDGPEAAERSATRTTVDVAGRGRRRRPARGTSTAAAPAASASRDEAWPSVRSPGRATNRLPGSTTSRSRRRRRGSARRSGRGAGRRSRATSSSAVSAGSGAAVGATGVDGVRRRSRAPVSHQARSPGPRSSGRGRPGARAGGRAS